MRERSDALAFKFAGLRGGMEAARQAGLPRLFGLEAEYEEGQLVNELEFVKALVRDIEQKTLDGLEMWHAFHEEGVHPSSQFAVHSDPDDVG